MVRIMPEKYAVGNPEKSTKRNVIDTKIDSIKNIFMNGLSYENEYFNCANRRLKRKSIALIRVCLYTPPILLTTLRFLALKGDFSRTNP